MPQSAAEQVLLSNQDTFESLFQLRKASSTSTLLIQADFSPLRHESSSIAGCANAVPQFNMDNKIYTPAFILGLDEPKHIENDQIYRDLHNRKTVQMVQQKLELFLPKPSKNNSFCCVCKTTFQDYLTHLSLQRHRLLMRKSEFNSNINDFCSLFKNHQQNVPKKRATRPPKIIKAKTISKVCILKRISSKDTSAEERSELSQISIIV